MNHSGISGQETMALVRNAIWMNIDVQLRLRLDLHSPENVELHWTLIFYLKRRSSFPQWPDFALQSCQQHVAKFGLNVISKAVQICQLIFRLLWTALPSDNWWLICIL